ncbi:MULTISPECIES: hypothetical protein [unclassified Streptomyces]|uniref:hypothetical protein n=1 Tax=unclassified Streptomyces TaxID=2593676 RepID=UPI001CA6C9BF|nr:MULTISPECIES: hypothetical protein [unclassified Streptomyces]MBY8841422.1 hypothetical protein [Streptomyces sp. SP2-10]
MGDGGGSDLRRGIDALKEFKGKLDNALTDFEDGHGSPSKLAQQSLSRGSFGGTNAPFDEAGDLHTAYETVHTRLTHLSKTLGMHIEALKLASHAADATYDGSDDEVQRRFWQIRAHLDAQYREDVKKAAPADKPGAEHKGDNKSTGKTDLS